MITAIEEAVLGAITSKIPELKTGGVQKSTQQLNTQTAVAVAVLEGTFERITDTSFRQDVTVSVLIKFKNLQSEEARRKGINPIIQGVIQLLIMKSLGLEIKKLKPKRFRDVTTEEKYAGGTIEYLLEFQTSFTIKVLDEEEAAELVTLGVSYLLTHGDSAEDAADVITTTV